MINVLELLKEVGAIITDNHFVLTNGRHSATYINKNVLYARTEKASLIGEAFAQQVKDRNVDTIVGPALGGIILSQWTAYHLSQLTGREVYGIFTEKTPESNQKFTRGYDTAYVKGKKIIVVEDLTTTGGSAKKVVDAVRSAGGEVVGVCVLVNRNPELVTSEYFGAPFFPLLEMKVEDFAESECPLCASGVPVNTTIGHGKKYLEAQQQ